MKLLAFSDIHCDRAACADIVAAAKAADLVIGAGDFASRHEGLSETMRILEPIASKAIYVPGNNETVEALRAATSARVLHGEPLEVGGNTVFGIGCAIPPLPPLPWQSYDLSEEAAEVLLVGIVHADILISHSPPNGVADVARGMGSIGSTAVRAAIERLQPALVFCGHVHDSWGHSGKIGRSMVHNLGPRVNWFEL